MLTFFTAIHSNCRLLSHLLISFGRLSCKLASTRENLPSGFTKNKGADQPAHLRSLISAFVIHWLESIISRLATSEITIFYLVSVYEQAGSNLTLSETLKTGLHDSTNYMSIAGPAAPWLEKILKISARSTCPYCVPKSNNLHWKQSKFLLVLQHEVLVMASRVSRQVVFSSTAVCSGFKVCCFPGQTILKCIWIYARDVNGLGVWGNLSGGRG